MIADCVDADPRATAKTYRNAAMRDLVIGGLSFAAGVVITVIAFTSASPDGRFVVMTGLIFVGLFEIIRGIYYLGQAAKHDRAGAETSKFRRQWL